MHLWRKQDVFSGTFPTAASEVLSTAAASQLRAEPPCAAVTAVSVNEKAVIFGSLQHCYVMQTRGCSTPFTLVEQGFTQYPLHNFKYTYIYIYIYIKSVDNHSDTQSVEPGSFLRVTNPSLPPNCAPITFGCSKGMKKLCRASGFAAGGSPPCLCLPWQGRKYQVASLPFCWRASGRSW